MDQKVIDAQRLEDGQLAANEAACSAAAAAAGVSSASADDCDDGFWSCPQCPWKHSAEKWKPMGWEAYVSGTPR